MVVVLVTGGAGLIGYNLCKRLLQDGLVVYCLDNFYSSVRDNIEIFKQHKNFYLIEEDITSDVFANARKYPCFDFIFHLACPASPKYYQSRPYYTTLICTKGTDNVLNLAKGKHTRVIFASTSEIYGEPLEHPQNESYRGNVSSVGIRSCYDEGKRMMEAMAIAHAMEYGTNIGIARIFNTYGPGMHKDDGRVVSNFITQAMNGERNTIYGDGKQTRSFCYVDDTVDGLIRLAFTNFQGPINIGNPSEITIKQLATTIRRQLNCLNDLEFLDFEYKTLPEDDPTKRCPDISLAKQLLNWVPTTSLDSGLRQTIYWIKNKE